MGDTPRVRIRATSGLYEVPAAPDESVLEALRRVGLPALGFLLLDCEGRFVSLADPVGERRIDAQALRNPDFDILAPSYELARTENPIAEVFEYGGLPPRPILRQLNEDSARDYVYRSVCAVLDDIEPGTACQLALSSGGDGRALAECVGRYLKEHRGPEITAVVTSVGFEDPESHVREARAIAERFALPVEVYDEERAAALLGYARPMEDIARSFSRDFPRDELEALGTFWVQEVNVVRAREAGRGAILFGYNLEDVIADRLYQLLSDAPLPAYPLRRISEDLVLAAPLSRVPKRVIDAIDQENSMRNYSVRVPSGSYLRSALYFVAYHIVERFPPLAHALASKPSVQQTAPGEFSLVEWLARQ